jgi:hypothetical protein
MMERMPVGAKNRPLKEIKLQRARGNHLIPSAGFLTLSQVEMHANPIAEQQD